MLNVFQANLYDALSQAVFFTTCCHEFQVCIAMALHIARMVTSRWTWANMEANRAVILSQHMCRARQHDKGTSGYSDMLLGQVYVNVTNAFSINFLAEGFKMCVAFIKHR